MFGFFRNFAVFLLVFFQVSAAWSIDYFDNSVTENEKAVFAYYRVGGIQPDFEKWIMDKISNSDLSQAREQEYLLQEQLRLGRGFGDYDAETDFMNIEAQVYVKFKQDEDGNGRVLFTFYKDDQAYTPTFDYPYLRDEKLRLVINRLGTFSDLPVPKDQYEAIKSKARADEDEWFGATLSLKVRVTRVDTENPLRRDERLQWLMVGEIAYIKAFVSAGFGGASTLWDWMAPWYVELYEEENKSEDEKYPHPFDLYK